MHPPTSFSLVLLTLLVLAALAAVPTEGAAPEQQTGESLVLAGTDPGQLVHRRLARGSVVVRSTYFAGRPNAVAYSEGKDYAVDYATGQIRRIDGSRIPD